MRKHPKHSKRDSTEQSSSSTTQRPAQKLPPPPPAELGQAPKDGGFLSLFLARVGWDKLNGLNQRKHPAGRSPQKLSRGQLLVLVVFHYTVSFAGTLGEHLLALLGIGMAESALSERRQALPLTVFKELLSLALRPLDQPSATAFYGGLRLAAIDGTTFSLPNTEQTKECKRGGNQKGRAAFAKLNCAVLVELLMHNPLAAQLGLEGESEWKLAHGLLDQLPEKCLLLLDRLYGCGAFLLPAWEKLQKQQGHFLARAKAHLKVLRVIERLPDGSQVVEIKALDPENHHRVIGTMTVREIRATIQRRGYRPVTLRLWTSLLDWTQAPAQELVELYIRRWEQELYFRELKRELGKSELLLSQTPETAAQEVAAMIIGSSLIAEERSKLKPGEDLSHRISFIKLAETLEPLWLTLLLGADILTEEQKQQLTDRFHQFAAKLLMPKKRTRSCPRALRQPVQAWPRKTNQISSNEPVSISIIKPS